MTTSPRHHAVAIENFEFIGASKVKTDPRYMWRIRLFQGLVGLTIIGFAARFAQMAGMQIPHVG